MSRIKHSSLVLTTRENFARAHSPAHDLKMMKALRASIRRKRMINDVIELGAIGLCLAIGIVAVSFASQL